MDSLKYACTNQTCLLPSCDFSKLGPGVCPNLGETTSLVFIRNPEVDIQVLEWPSYILAQKRNPLFPWHRQCRPCSLFRISRQWALSPGAKPCNDTSWMELLPSAVLFVSCEALSNALEVVIHTTTSGTSWHIFNTMSIKTQVTKTISVC